MSIHGSSPRGRGKRPPTGLGRSYRWLIPARAGKTCGEASAAGSDWAHPRAGGENFRAASNTRCAFGSSPRGRGKHATARLQVAREGLIPARAGKTYPRTTRRSGPRAHPRAGGENWVGTLGRSGGDGSSPRGRGKQSAEIPCDYAARLIPARAGKTERSTFSPSGEWAHPRAGGENGDLGLGDLALGGSSPRGRGKHDGGHRAVHHDGLIPARAGKTLDVDHVAAIYRAHPRMGGENRRLPGVVAPVAWLIPAWAGKTDRPRRPGRATPAHPRMGGENLGSPITSHHDPGSSPHGRGKLEMRLLWRRRLGLIPARAGKTPTVQRPHRTGWAHPRAGGENSL